MAATIRLAVSGLAPHVAIVWPLLPRVVEAFRPFGINFMIESGIKLSDDPENSDGGWQSLIDDLTARSQRAQPPAPAHLVVTVAPPNFQLDINGELKDPTRGIVAVFTGASIYRPYGPAHSPDVLTQVCIHELGHMLNLTHGDALGAGYSSTMMQTTERLRQPLSVAWTDAIADAHTLGEPPVAMPGSPVLYYPFDANCRRYLRVAASDPAWLPWRSEFRDDLSSPAEDQFRAVDVQLRLHGASRHRRAHSGLYFTAKFTNRGIFPIELPGRIGPEFGTLQIAISRDGVEAHIYRPSNFRCSQLRQVLQPGKSIHRSFALPSREGRPMFPDPGDYSCVVSLRQSHGAHAATFGRAKAEIRIDGGPRAPNVGSFGTVGAGKKSRSAAVRAQEVTAFEDSFPRRSSGLFHAKYMRAAHVHDRNARKALLNECTDKASPPAIQHAAALRLAIERMREGVSWRAILKRYEKQFPAPLGAELHEAIKQTGDGWEKISALAGRKA